MNEYACRKCHRILSSKKCPVCQTTDVSKNWKGLVIVLKPDKSEVAKELKIETSGMYALRVR